MRFKVLFEADYQVLGVVDGDICHADVFIYQGEAHTSGWREGLAIWLDHVAENGLQKTPPAWFKVVDRNEKIFEFKKGDLRLFFFQGVGRQVAVCSTGVVKKGQKVDPQAVASAIRHKHAYFAAHAAHDIEVIYEDE